MVECQPIIRQWPGRKQPERPKSNTGLERKGGRGISSLDQRHHPRSINLEATGDLTSMTYHVLVRHVRMQRHCLQISRWFSAYLTNVENSIGVCCASQRTSVITSLQIPETATFARQHRLRFIVQLPSLNRLTG